MWNPQNQPERRDDTSTWKEKTSAPAVAKTLENPIPINQARPTPNNEPSAQPIEAAMAPSIIATYRKSERVIPNARTVAYSFCRTSMSMVMMVTTSNTPAAMVNDPNTRNIAVKTPEEASACSRASILTARTERYKSLTPTRESRCSSSVIVAPVETLFTTNIDRSRLSAAAKNSASLMLIIPRMTGSKSDSEERRSSSMKEPLMVRLSDSSEPNAY